MECSEKVKLKTIQQNYKYVYTIIYFIILICIKENILYKNFFKFYTFDYYILILSFLIFMSLKNFINRIFFIVWTIWIILGNNYMYISFIQYGRDIDTSVANNIYMLYLFIFTLGLKTIEVINYKILNKSINKRIKVKKFLKNRLIILMLMFFPIISLIEILLTVGYLPIFHEKNYVNYNLNLGFISSKFVLFGLISGIYIYIKMLNTKKNVLKITFFLILFLDIIQMVSNGARFRFLLFIISLFFVNLKLKNDNKIKVKDVIKYTLILCIAYVIGFIIRKGIQLNFYNVLDSLSVIGGEYRDWNVTLEYLKNLDLQQYDLFKSSLVRLFNPNLLTLLGVDSSYLNSLSSANYFSHFFNAQNGIRIGIVGELHYAYGYWGMSVFYIFSLIVSYINIKVLNDEDMDSFIFLVILTAYNLLTIMGQLNVLFGGIKNLIFSFLILFIANKLTTKKFVTEKMIIGEEK